MSSGWEQGPPPPPPILPCQSDIKAIKAAAHSSESLPNGNLAAESSTNAGPGLPILRSPRSNLSPRPAYFGYNVDVSVNPGGDFGLFWTSVFCHDTARFKEPRLDKDLVTESDAQPKSETLT